MSRTRGLKSVKRQKGDAYDSPPWSIDLGLDLVHLPGRKILEPCAGRGTVVRLLLERGVSPANLTAVELDRDRANVCRAIHAPTVTSDFFDWMLGEDAKSGFDLIITNPPFSHAQQFADACLELVRARRGTVAFLLRNGWFGSLERIPFHLENPADDFVFSRRPSFLKKKTDSTEYVWWVAHPRATRRQHILVPRDFVKALELKSVAPTCPILPVDGPDADERLFIGVDMGYGPDETVIVRVDKGAKPAFVRDPLFAAMLPTPKMYEPVPPGTLTVGIDQKYVDAITPPPPAVDAPRQRIARGIVWLLAKLVADRYDDQTGEPTMKRGSCAVDRCPHDRIFGMPLVFCEPHEIAYEAGEFEFSFPPPAKLPLSPDALIGHVRELAELMPPPASRGRLFDDATANWLRYARDVMPAVLAHLENPPAVARDEGASASVVPSPPQDTRDVVWAHVGLYAPHHEPTRHLTCQRCGETYFATFPAPSHLYEPMIAAWKDRHRGCYPGCTRPLIWINPEIPKDTFEVRRSRPVPDLEYFTTVPATVTAIPLGAAPLMNVGGTITLQTTSGTLAGANPPAPLVVIPKATCAECFENLDGPHRAGCARGLGQLA